MRRRLIRLGLTGSLAALVTVVVYAAASYPSSVKSFTTKIDGAGNTIFAVDINGLQDEVVAIEQALLNGFAHNLKFASDATYDIGASGANRPRDAFLSRNATVGGTLTATGATTLTGGFTASTNSTVNGTGAADNQLTVSTTTTNPVGMTLSNATTGVLAQFEATNAKGLNLVVNGGNTFGLEISSAGINRMRAYGAGTATFDASGNLSSVSDERLKFIDGGYRRGLSDLRRLHPIRYRWRPESGLEQQHEYAGFSAQDVRRAIPEAVFAVEANRPLSLQDRPILAAVVNAVRELDAQHRRDVARIAALERRLQALER